MTALTPDDWTAICLSLKVALSACLVGTPLALGVALIQSRARSGWRLLLDTLVTLPLVLPPVATGYGLLLLLGRRGPLGHFLESVGVVFAFDWTGAALAAGIMAFPLMVRPMRLAIDALDDEVDQVARTLGASSWQRFFRLTLPLAGPGIAAGAILGFAKALGEFGATITFVAAIPGKTLTLPAAIYNATQSPGGEARAMILCLAATVLAVGAVLVSDQLGRMALRVARGPAA